MAAVCLLLPNTPVFVQAENAQSILSCLAPPTRPQDKLAAWTESVLRQIEERIHVPRNQLTLTQVAQALNQSGDSGMVFLESGNASIAFALPAAEISSGVAEERVLVGSKLLNPELKVFTFSKTPEDLHARERTMFNLKKLGAYIPIDVFAHVLESGELSVPEDPLSSLVEHDECTVVNIDLSGFTRLSEELKKRYGEEAKEHVLSLTNDLLSDLSNIILKYEGSVVKFGGDARTVLLSGKEHTERGMELANRVQALLFFYRDLVKDKYGWENPIRISIGIASGPAYLFLSRDNDGYRDILPLGHIWFQAGTAEDLAQGETGAHISAINRLSVREDAQVQFKTDDTLGAEYTPALREELRSEKVHIVKKTDFLRYKVGDMIAYYREFLPLVEQAYPPTDPKDAEKFLEIRAALSGLEKRLAEESLNAEDLKKIDLELISGAGNFFKAYEQGISERDRSRLRTEARLRTYLPYYRKRRAVLLDKYLAAARQKGVNELRFLDGALAGVRSFIRPSLEEHIMRDERSFDVPSVNFQNLAFVFVGVDGLNEWFEGTEKDPAARREGLRKIENFTAKMNAFAKEQEDITPLKWDIGPHGLKWFLVSGMTTGKDAEHRAVVAAKNFIQMAKEEFGLDLKVGINSGPVTFGLTGDPKVLPENKVSADEEGEREWTSLGPGVNLAARLSTKKGQILVSKDVTARTAGKIRYAGKGSILAKGIGEVEVFEPVEILESAPMKYFPYQGELASLRDWWSEYYDSGSFEPAFLIQHQMGMGADELVDRFRQDMEKRNVSLYQNSGTIERNEIDLFHSLLSNFFGLYATDSRPERVRKITEKTKALLPEALSRLALMKLVFSYLTFPGEDMLKTMDTQEQWSGLSALIRELMAKEAESRPMVVALVHINRIAGSTNRLLEPFLGGIQEPRIGLLIGSDGYPQGEWTQVVRQKEPGPPERRIELRPLTHPEMMGVFEEQMEPILQGKGLKARIAEKDRINLKLLVQAHFIPQEARSIVRLSDTQLYDRLVENLYALSGRGNLTFLNNQIRGLWAKLEKSPSLEKLIFEILREHAAAFGGMTGADGKQINVEEAVIAGRYEKGYFLNEAYRDMLSAAMCFGQTFDADLLKDYLTMDDEKFGNLLFELTKSGIFVSTENEQRLAFGPYVYEVFSRRYGKDEMRKGRLKLARFLYDRPEKERNLLAPLASAQYFAALDLNRKWSELSEKIGFTKQDLLDAMDSLEAAGTYYENAYRLEEGIERRKELLQALVYLLADTENIGMTADERADLLAKVLQTHEKLGFLYGKNGPLSEAIVHYRQAANSIQDLGRKIELLGVIASLHQRMGDVDRAGEVIQELMQCNEQFRPEKPEDKKILLSLFVRIGYYMIDKGEWDKVGECFRSALAIVQEMGPAAEIPDVQRRITGVLLGSGVYQKHIEEPEKAMKYYGKALLYAEATGSVHNQIVSLLNLAELEIALNMGEEAYRHANEAVALTEKQKTFRHTAFIYRGAAQRLLGNNAAARKDLEEAYHMMKGKPFEPYVRVTLLRELGRSREEENPRAAMAALRMSVSVAKAITDPQNSDKEYLDGALALLETYLRYRPLNQTHAFLKRVQERERGMDKKTKEKKGFARRKLALERLEAEVLWKLEAGRDSLHRDRSLRRILQNFRGSLKPGDRLAQSKSLLVLLEALSDKAVWPDKPSLWFAGSTAVREYGPGIIQWLKEQPSPYDRKRLEDISRLVLELFPERGPKYLDWSDSASEELETAA